LKFGIISISFKDNNEACSSQVRDLTASHGLAESGGLVVTITQQISEVAVLVSPAQWNTQQTEPRRLRLIIQQRGKKMVNAFSVVAPGTVRIRKQRI
jgi:hypothetical protein